MAQYHAIPTAGVDRHYLPIAHVTAVRAHGQDDKATLRGEVTLPVKRF